MKIPSIAVLGEGLYATLRRWPLSIVLAVVTTVLLIRVTTDYSANDHEWMWTVILSCYAGMLLTIAATIFAESRHLRIGGRVLSQSIALGLALLFYYWVPAQDMPRVVTCLVVFLALHWLIAFLPYSAPGDSTPGFWRAMYGPGR